MCGRYAAGGFVRSEFRTWGLSVPKNFTDTYNASPGQLLPVAHRESPLKAELMKWGLVPFWSDGPTVKFSTINARAETVATSPTYRTAFAKRRCLVPAEAYYEWKRLSDKTKVPYCIKLKTRPFFAFAGIWDEWRDASGHALRSYAIITCPPNAVMSEIHTRMPVILAQSHELVWTDPKTSPATLLSLLTPYKAEEMEAYAVNRRVNNPDNNDIRLMQLESKKESVQVQLQFDP